MIEGPAGPLEAVLEEPQGHSGKRFAVICHPHPLHGGTLNNKVVHTLARAMQELGLPTIRFNFRGVGASAGTFDQGAGETEDALAVIAHGRARWAGAALWLGGFSFGAAIVIRAAPRALPERLVAVAPPVGRIDVSGISPACPWLIVHGDADEVVDHHEVLQWAKRLTPAPAVALLHGATHFFHGRLHDLHAAVSAFGRDAFP